MFLTMCGIKTIEKRIEKEKICAEYIYHDESQKVIKRLEESEDSYLKERIHDIQAVTSRLISRMKGDKQVSLKNLKGATVVAARYLSPADILGLSVRKNLAFCTSIGGATSHMTLIAKSLSIPAVCGLGEIAEKIPSDVRVVIDGYAGLLIVNPSRATIKHYRLLKQSETQLKRQLAQLKAKPSITKDGYEVAILSNIELPNEIPKALAAGSQGVGLYRTEYLFLTRADFPSMEEQYKTYSSILRKMGKKPVVIRTFDLGGDKFPEVAGKKFELNPFLGWRAIRVCLDRPDIFKPQIKALLKASRWGNLAIMIPMISNYEELMATKAIIEECKSELRREKTQIKENIPIGVMIEVPSAVMIADHLARECDFFSIGTNDLIQYSLAVDRSNEYLSKLYQSFHPAVLSLIKMSIDAAHRHRIKISVCGELAADPLASVLLVGLGIDELSASFHSTGILKRIIRSIKFSTAREIAGKTLGMKSGIEVESFLKEEISHHFPDLKPVIQFSGRGSNGGNSTAQK